MPRLERENKARLRVRMHYRLLWCAKQTDMRFHYFEIADLFRGLQFLKNQTPVGIDQNQ